jgi:hypothetical protein
VSAPKARVHENVAITQGVTRVAVPTRRVTANSGDRHYLPAGTKMTSEKADHVVGSLDADRDVAKPKAGERACADFVITRGDPFVDVPHTMDSSQPQRTLKLCAPSDAVKVERR